MPLPLCNTGPRPQGAPADPFLWVIKLPRCLPIQPAAKTNPSLEQSRGGPVLDSLTPNPKPRPPAPTPAFPSPRNWAVLAFGQPDSQGPNLHSPPNFTYHPLWSWPGPIPHSVPPLTVGPPLTLCPPVLSNLQEGRGVAGDGLGS